jgi:alanine racemase
LPAEVHRAWLEVDLGAIRRNAGTLVRHSGARLLPMVKADAYGVGVGPALRVLETLDPWGYGVATVAEGEELRALGVTRPVLVFTPLTLDEHDRALAARLTLALGDTESIRAWARAGGEWHLAVDTGMARAGLDWRELPRMRELIAGHQPAGVFTHFHSAETSARSIADQEQRFEQALASMPTVPALVHTDNSAAIVRRGRSRLPLVRPGIFLYGAGYWDGAQLVAEPVVSVRARIVDLRDAMPGDTVSYGATYRVRHRARVATVAYGHADGYPIAMSGVGVALLNGATVPVVGRVTMDMTMLDVTGVRCARGDVVTFIGSDGNAVLTVDDVASRAGVSPYELLVRMRNRMPRLYSGE